MKTLPILALAVSTVVLAACSARTSTPLEPVPIAQGAAVCARAPAVCERLCADCPDPETCLANGGECLTGLWFKDVGDVKGDIWTPGCHYEFDDDVCTPPGRFFAGDECTGEGSLEILEFTLSACHPAGDRAIFNCNDECLRNHRGRGRCVDVPDVCNGQPSAQCVCDQPAPTP